MKRIWKEKKDVEDLEDLKASNYKKQSRMREE
jgi:hypothetical protein